MNDIEQLLKSKYIKGIRKVEGYVYEVDFNSCVGESLYYSGRRAVKDETRYFKTNNCQAQIDFRENESYSGIVFNKPYPNHPNIDPDGGNPCLDGYYAFFERPWKEKDLVTVVVGLIHFLGNGESSNPANPDYEKLSKRKKKKSKTTLLKGLY